MKRTKQRTAVVASALMGVLGLVSQSHAAVYPASHCVEDGHSGHVDYFVDGTVANQSTSSSVFLMCGLATISDVVPNGSMVEEFFSPLTSIDVRVYDGSSTEQIQCTGYQRRMNPTGGTYAVSSSTDSTGSSVSFTGNETLNLSFTAGVGPDLLDYYYNVSCRLPRSTGSTSKVFALRAPYEEY